MKKRVKSKRHTIQAIAFAVVILTMVFRLVLFLSGIAVNMKYSTIDAFTWTGLAIGLGLILISCLFPNKA